MPRCFATERCFIKALCSGCLAFHWRSYARLRSRLAVRQAAFAALAFSGVLYAIADGSSCTGPWVRGGIGAGTPMPFRFYHVNCSSNTVFSVGDASLAKCLAFAISDLW